MKIPLEISYRGVEKTEHVEEIIREKAHKLDHLTDDIVRCRVVLDSPHHHQQSGRPFSVRIEITLPASPEIVITRDSSEGSVHDNLLAVLNEAFDAAGRQIKKLVQRQRGEIKSHPEQERVALVTKIFRDQGYGFILADDGREIYFHRNAVIQDDFERIEIGTGVRFTEEAGEEGPQASTVQIVDKPGVSAHAQGS